MPWPVNLLCLVLQLVTVLSIGQHATGHCDQQFRFLNGSCSHSQPRLRESGRAGQLLYPALPLLSNYSIWADLPQGSARRERVNEWVAAWLAFLKTDIVDPRETVEGVINIGTPLLDLSNIYGVESGPIQLKYDVNAEDSLAPLRNTMAYLMWSEHVRVSRELEEVNPGWSEERRHQEARNIVIGEYQNIIKTELLPFLLGAQKTIINKDDDDTIDDPELSGNDVAGLSADIAFQISQTAKSGEKTNGWQNLAEKILLIPLEVANGGPISTRRAELKEVWHLTERMHVDRWRSIRSICPVSKRINPKYLELNPVIGSHVEQPVDGGVLGPTMACLLARALQKVISVDQFWFDKLEAGSMSWGQVKNIGGIRLASLLCANVNLPDNRIQPSAFLLPDIYLNSPISCDNVPKLDLQMWESVHEGLGKEREADLDEAIQAAEEALLRFRKYEYRLFSENKIPIGRGGAEAMAARMRQSLKVQSTVNTSALYELVTYELLNRPSLRHLVDKDVAYERKKRQAVTFDLAVDDPFVLNDLTEEGSRKSRMINDQIKDRISSRNRQNFVFSLDSSIQPPPLEAKTSTFPFVDEVTRHKFNDMLEMNKITRMGKCFPSEELKRCDSAAKYRTFSGWCNNLNIPSWGQANTVLRRFSPSQYNDGIAAPKSRGARGSQLPNPRKISREIHTSETDLDPKYTMMVMQWGQFVDHDVAHTPQVRGHGNSVLQCRECDSHLRHPACLPIPIVEDDGIFRTTQCIPFVRSNAGHQRIGPREQVNQVSAFLDASIVYGSDECLAKELRDPANPGRLLTLPHPVDRTTLKPLLPRTREQPDCFSPSGECFLAGDLRVNEHPGLTVMHTVLVREHNTLANGLARINPHWDANRVFEEARKIVVAEVQHITFNEFLPRVLGHSRMRTYDLDLLSTGYWDRYNDQCSGQIFTEFSTAAFRFGHSMIRPNLTLMTNEDMMGVVRTGRALHSATGPGVRSIPLRSHFNNPDITMEENMIDDLLRGLLMTPMETIDNKITNEVTAHLFEEKAKNQSGMDLVSLNIQRSRDHAIPGYNRYRELCKLKKAETFQDFSDQMESELVQRFEELYDHPDDVDLFPALLSEKKLPGALTGHTLGCLIGLQFSLSRKCDRFWYETNDKNIGFTEAQLREVKKSSLASTTCRNQDGSTMTSRSVMDQIDRLTNPMVDCEKDIQHIDLEAWREDNSKSNVFCEIGSRSISLGATMRVSPCTECSCTSQGTKCGTVKIDSCLTLVQTWGLKAVDLDQTCRPQCTII